MSGKNCLDFETILDYLQHTLPEQDVARVEQHLKECGDCHQRLEESWLLVADLREDAALQVPKEVHKRAVALFRPVRQARRRTGQETFAGLKKFVAQLVMDTRLKPGLSLPAMAGLRLSPVANNSYQLLYSMDDGRIEVDLDIHQVSSDGRFNLIGQVTGVEAKECLAELVALEKEVTLENTPDETFTFAFENIERGGYALNIYCDDRYLEVIPLFL
ncbi:MAG TPA: zf-HC2 domain-containing protein [Chloroflexia bacterium]|nr:zf-HC2 domain-containing protein [Chloroflexia bacterium]